ncbi:hypothetical protein [Streptomyces sp. NPDC004629]|uniref:hypothetical protein n=1 Tax=Streptomyces sp. NPDC004629 TaxID=3364705 RepID=UPI0036A74AD4
MRLKLRFAIGSAWTDREHNQFIWLNSYDGPGTFAERNALYWSPPERSAMGLNPDHYLVAAEERAIESVAASMGPAGRPANAPYRNPEAEQTL